VLLLKLAQSLEIVIHAPLRDDSATPQEQAKGDGSFKEFGEDVVGCGAFVEVFPHRDFEWVSQDGDCKDGQEDEGPHHEESLDEGGLGENAFRRGVLESMFQATSCAI